MKRLLGILLALLWCVSATAQTPAAPISGVAANQFGQPIPNAKIWVCNVTSTGTPCAPTAQIYQDYNLTIPLSQPYQADQYGNYTVFVGAGSPENLYTVQITQGGNLFFSYVLNGPASQGTGSVTNFSSGDLAPLFTTNVTNPSTTPNQQFTLTPSANSSFFGNFGGASGPASYWTLVAGANTTITPNTGAKTVTVASTGGGGGANLPHVTQGISGDGTGNGVGMPEKPTTIAGGQAFVAADEDVANGRFDCRNPIYAGGCLGNTQQAAMQAFSDRLICYQAMTGNHARTSFPPAIIRTGTPTQPTLLLPAGANYDTASNITGATVVFQPSYNNNEGVKFIYNLTSTTNCSDGSPHQSTLTGGSYVGLGEHGCNQGGCINAPGDSGSYPLGGPLQKGIEIVDGQYYVDRVGALNNGMDGVVIGGLEAHTHELWGAANDYYPYFGLDQAGQHYVFAPNECHADIDLVSLDGIYDGPNEAYGTFMTPGSEYGYVAGICWGGGSTMLGPVFSQIEEVGVIRGGGQFTGTMTAGSRIDAPRGDGIRALGGNDTYINPRIVSACSYDGVENYLVSSVTIATPGSGQTPGTYVLTGNTGSAQIQVVVNGSGTVTAAPTVLIPGRGYPSGGPTFTLSAGGTPATFTVTMQTIYSTPFDGIGPITTCDYIHDASAGDDTYISPGASYLAFFGTSYATADYLTLGTATWISPHGNNYSGKPIWEQGPGEVNGQGQSIVQSDFISAGGGFQLAGTDINLDQTGSHIGFANTSPTLVASVEGGQMMQDLWILGDGNTTLPAAPFNSNTGGFVTCTGFNLLLNSHQWYHFFVASGEFFTPPVMVEQCDSINQNFWQVGFSGIFPSPTLNTLAAVDVAGDMKVRALTQPASGNFTTAGTGSTFSYCLATKMWFAGGVAATTPICTNVTPVIPTSMQNVFYHVAIPLDWTEYKIYMQSTTDPSVQVGVWADVQSPTGQPQTAIPDIGYAVVPTSPTDTSTIPTAQLGTKSTGMYNMSRTDIPATSAWIGVPGQMQIDPTAGTLWYATGVDTWTSWALGGGGGGGCGTGTTGQVLVSTGASCVPDTFMSDLAQSTGGASGLTYTGNGASFSTSLGGAYAFTSTDSSSSGSTPSFGVTLTESATGAANAAGASFTLHDAGTNSGSGNFGVTSTTNGPSAGVFTFSTTNTTSTNAADINLTAHGAAAGSGNIILSATGSGSDGKVGITATGPFTVSSLHATLDSSGNLTVNSCTGCSSGTSVTSINTVAGAFTFSFSAGAGSCSGTTCTFTGSGAGGGSVTNFVASSGSWPSWLVPSVATSSTTPTLSVAASTIPVSAGGTGVATLTGIAKGAGTSAFTTAASTDVIGLWSGSCSTTTFLRGDGTCVTPGGGGTVTGTGTANTLAMWTSTSAIGLSPLTVSAGVLFSSDALTINDGSGNGGLFASTEGATPAGAAGIDNFWGDSATHRFKMNMNTSGAVFAMGLTAQGTAGNCLQLATNGYDATDAGAPCGTGGGGGGTPTHVADSGAGTGPTIAFLGTATDFHGWVSVVTGTAPAASAGVVTINYSLTQPVIPKCSSRPANTAAQLLVGAAGVFVPQASSTTSNFVMQVGSTALAAATTYIWEWDCGF